MKPKWPTSIFDALDKLVARLPIFLVMGFPRAPQSAGQSGYPRGKITAWIANRGKIKFKGLTCPGAVREVIGVSY